MTKATTLATRITMLTAAALTAVAITAPASAATTHSTRQAVTHGGVAPATTSSYSWCYAHMPLRNGPVLRYGATGTYVRIAQCELSLGWNGSIDRDGIFGSQTRSIVRSFQRNWGLNPDGVIGPKTWAMLYRHVCDGAGHS